jgi:hypothetical protein
MGARCQVTREALGLSQEEMALTMGIANTTLSGWEVGRNRIDIVSLPGPRTIGDLRPTGWPAAICFRFAQTWPTRFKPSSEASVPCEGGDSHLAPKVQNSFPTHRPPACRGCPHERDRLHRVGDANQEACASDPRPLNPAVDFAFTDQELQRCYRGKSKLQKPGGSWREDERGIRWPGRPANNGRRISADAGGCLRGGGCPHKSGERHERSWGESQPCHSH